MITDEGTQHSKFAEKIKLYDEMLRKVLHLHALSQ
jgi:hypothetical protein